MTPAHSSSRGHLRISLRRFEQLFNSLDPSPFYEKDLDADAERFLVSWAQELPADAPFKLTLHLREAPAEGEEAARAAAQDAVHHYFAERARLAKLDRHRLLRLGRTSLGVGLGFLVACMGAAELLATRAPGVLAQLLREGLTIVGWVAMWRPLQIYLYDWWPLRQQETTYHRMARMPVSLKVRPAAAQ